MILDGLDLAIWGGQGINSGDSILERAALGIDHWASNASFVAVLLQVFKVATVTALGFVAVFPILEPILGFVQWAIL
jgi:hypothetical protein